MTGGGEPKWRIWIAAARPRTLPAAVAPVAVGSGLAAGARRFDPGAAALCLGFAVLVQIGANLANDYYDFVKGADRHDRIGPRRAVASGLVPPGTMRSAMALVFAAAFLVGLGLVAKGGLWLVAVGVVSILCAIAYTGGPFPLGYRGLGDVFVFLFFGVVGVAATSFVQVGRLTREAVAASIPIGLLAANILLVNNYRDMETDAAAGKRTLVVRFGRRVARMQYALSQGVALAVPVLFWIGGRGPWCLLPAVLAPLGWLQYRRLARGGAGPEMNALLADTAKLLALYAALFATGLALG